MLVTVILQYGRWQDTVACLQSLVPAVTAGQTRVVVVDNASPDDSLAQVRAWMHGAHAAVRRPQHDPVAAHWWPLTGASAAWTELDHTTPFADTPTSPWLLVRAAANRGFAAGMNVGIRRALADARTRAVWLLNNDTVVAPTTVAAIGRTITTAAPVIGQFGMTVCYYDRPDIIQSTGWCRWNAWLATSERYDDGARIGESAARALQPPGYVYGASWVVRSEALHDVGLLSEDTFLYGEELDWTCRAAPRWQTALIGDALVWHREGATVGAGKATGARRSALADLSGIASRLRVTHRFFPSRLPTVYCSVLAAALNRLRRGDPRRALAVARLACRGGLPGPRPFVRDPSATSRS
jgi:GT2 family glycosyltransferase